MRVALVSPPWYAVPPKGYGGIELVVSYLAEGLVERGVDVTLFATGDSETTADLEWVHDVGPSVRIGETVPELEHVLHAAERADEFDVVNDHSGPLGAAVLAATGALVLHTVHGPLDNDLPPIYRRLCGMHPNLGLNSLSRSQRRPARDLRWVANVPNAIDTNLYCPGEAPREDFLLFLGRMCPEKGAHRAIEVARASGRPLLMAAKCREPAEKRYFDELVRPQLGNGIEYLGEVPLCEKVDLLQRAAATLFPIDWEEPFGLVMIESAACGTPVLATRRGSVPEVVEDGVTGVVVDSHEDMPGAIDRALALDPAAMRTAVVERFDVEAMVSAYLAIYERAARSVTFGRRDRPAVAAPRSADASVL